MHGLFLSTPSARRATKIRPSGGLVQQISIHALCEEGDRWFRMLPCTASDFYPRPLRGGRLQSSCLVSLALQFLSTPSARRATDVQSYDRSTELISIHALCEEGDGPAHSSNTLPVQFLSTPSARRATCRCRLARHQTRHFYPRPLQ